MLNKITLFALCCFFAVQAKTPAAGSSLPSLESFALEALTKADLPDEDKKNLLFNLEAFQAAHPEYLWELQTDGTFLPRPLTHSSKVRSQYLQKILADTTAIMSEPTKTTEAKLADLKAYHHRLSSALLPGLYSNQDNARVRGLVEYYVWAKIGAQVNDQVMPQVRAQVNDQVWDQVEDQVRDQVRVQVRAQVRDQIWDQVLDQVLDQVRDQVKAPVGDQVRTKVWYQLRGQVSAQLNSTDFTNEESWRPAVRTATEYAFTVYQLASLIIRYSPEFRAIAEGLAARYPDLDIRIAVPEYTGDSHFIQTQLEIFRRFVPAP